MELLRLVGGWAWILELDAVVMPMRIMSPSISSGVRPGFLIFGSSVFDLRIFSNSAALSRDLIWVRVSFEWPLWTFDAACETMRLLLRRTEVLLMIVVLLTPEAFLVIGVFLLVGVTWTAGVSSMTISSTLDTRAWDILSCV
jgi:hypothetical protein